MFPFEKQDVPDKTRFLGKIDMTYKVKHVGKKKQAAVTARE